MAALGWCLVFSHFRCLILSSEQVRYVYTSDQKQISNQIRFAPFLSGTRRRSACAWSCLCCRPSRARSALITQEFRFYYKKYPGIFHGMLLDIWAHFTNRTDYGHNPYGLCPNPYGLCHYLYNMQVHVQWLWLNSWVIMSKSPGSLVTLAKNVRPFLPESLDKPGDFIPKWSYNVAKF